MRVGQSGRNTSRLAARGDLVTFAPCPFCANATVPPRSPQPRPRLLRNGEASSGRQDRGDLGRSQAGPALLPRAARRRLREGLRHPGLNHSAGSDGWDRPLKHQGHPRSAPATGVPASIRAGRPSNIDATALPQRGGHPITIVVADDKRFVEHLGNAGRPHVADRPTPSLHRPSGSSTSFVLASLRAVHVDQHLRAGALRAQRALTSPSHTGNAGSEAFAIGRDCRSVALLRGGWSACWGGLYRRIGLGRGCSSWGARGCRRRGVLPGGFFERVVAQSVAQEALAFFPPPIYLDLKILEPEVKGE
jgi:hypothetical protein